MGPRTVNTYLGDAVDGQQHPFLPRRRRYVGFRFAYHAFLVVWSNIPPLFGSLIRHVANVHWPEGHGNAYRLYGSSKLGVVCYISRRNFTASRQVGEARVHSASEPTVESIYKNGLFDEISNEVKVRYSPNCPEVA
jgi:hypothetical protein